MTVRGEVGSVASLEAQILALKAQEQESGKNLSSAIAALEEEIKHAQSPQGQAETNETA